MNKSNRRAFLKQTALAASGMLIAPAVLPVNVRGGNRTEEVIINSLDNNLKATAFINQSNFKQWVPTPPMGWNSFDCYGSTVEEHEVKANADYMAEKLKKYGWEYVVIDIRWYVENCKVGAGGYNLTDPRFVVDEWGRFMPAVNRFPSAADGKGFKALADYVHSKGLKFGVHIMRGVPQTAVEKKMPIKGTNGITADQIYTTEGQTWWLNDNYSILADKPGAQEYYNSIVDMYAEWGVDFIKADDISRAKDDIGLLRKAIDQCGRPIVLSISGGTPRNRDVAEHMVEHANMWRTTGDVWDRWEDIRRLIDVAQFWYPYIKPGTWPDCDMIPLGRISIRGEIGEDRRANLTIDEQYTLMTFFAIFRSPLMFGGDLPSNDDFTLSLLTNANVLQMHRESTDVRQLFRQDGKVAVTSRNPKTGEKYLAVLNISDETQPMKISVALSEMGINGKCNITNVWTGENTGTFTDEFSPTLPAHASGLYCLTEIP